MDAPAAAPARRLAIGDGLLALTGGDGRIGWPNVAFGSATGPGLGDRLQRVLGDGGSGAFECGLAGAALTEVRPRLQPPGAAPRRLRVRAAPGDADTMSVMRLCSPRLPAGAGGYLPLRIAASSRSS